MLCPKIKISISINVEGLIHSSCVIVEIVFRRSGRRSRWLCQRRMRSEVLVHRGTEGHRSARVRGPPVLHYTRRGGNLCWIQSLRHRTDSLWTFITLFIKMVSIFTYRVRYCVHFIWWCWNDSQNYCRIFKNKLNGQVHIQNGGWILLSKIV